MIRPQYHFRQGPDGLRAWNVARLIREARELPVTRVPLSEITEFDEAYWGKEALAVRDIADHAKLIASVDLSFPIILCADGRVMDGMHRVARAYAEGMTDIPAYRFRMTPKPDFVGVEPDDLSYDPVDFLI